MTENPFYITGRIPEEYFCDRVEDTKTLIKSISGSNVVLVSPRRMGKSGLILHCFESKEVRKNYATLYIDILQTTSLREFVYLFGKKVYENLVPKSTKRIQAFFQILKSLTGKISFDAITGFPAFNMMLGEIKNPELTLNEIFEYIEKYDKKCLIAFDEFQQITKYPEKNVEAILRSHIQHLNNARFIYSGSEMHIMYEMFQSYSRPFYSSSAFLALKPIPIDEYREFAIRMFDKFEKKLSAVSFDNLYNLFDGYTFYIQKTLHEAFFSTKEDKECCDDNLAKAIDHILESNTLFYQEVLSYISERQKELLYAIAIEGEAEGITSANFMQKYNLASASSVQAATKQLLERGLITKKGRLYSVSDKFFRLWIMHLYNAIPVYFGK